jgi:hypothetical protein
MLAAQSETRVQQAAGRHSRPNNHVLDFVMVLAARCKTASSASQTCGKFSKLSHTRTACSTTHVVVTSVFMKMGPLRAYLPLRRPALNFNFAANVSDHLFFLWHNEKSTIVVD